MFKNKFIVGLLALAVALTAACGPVDPQIEAENATLQAELSLSNIYGC